jgi:dihydroorotate dehydrogenase
MYKLLRHFLFIFPPESVHYFSMNLLRIFSRIFLIRKIISSSFSGLGGEHSEYSKNLWGLTFRNPIGLGAGFDKNALFLKELELLGFGFVEIGTVTPLAQKGNDRPRLFRLPKDHALINRMGFNNDGVKKIALRLKKWNQDSRRSDLGKPRLLIGGNIGKNKDTPNDEAWKDYEICFMELWDHVDYFVVNLSSPNTPGLRELQEKNPLRKILTHLQTLNGQLAQVRQERIKPLLLKIAPDLSWEHLDEIIELTMEIRLEGLVVSNTTLSREGLQTPAVNLQAMAGGLSGIPLKKRSTEIVDYIHQKTKGSLTMVASGGVFTAEDAREKIGAGASLVQVWTGFIYEGPGIVKKILRNPL